MLFNVILGCEGVFVDACETLCTFLFFQFRINKPLRCFVNAELNINHIKGYSEILSTYFFCMVVVVLRSERAPLKSARTKSH